MTGTLSGSDTVTPLRGRAAQLVILALATAAGVFARTSLSPVQEAMRVALGFSDNQMALLQGPAMALPVLIAATPIGLAIDRHSRVRLVLFFAVSLALGSFMTAISSHFLALFLSRCLVGLAGPAIWMAAMSLLADLYLPMQRGRANMVVVVGQCLGNSAAFALGGTLLALAGPGPGAWRYALLALTVPLVLTASLTLLMREPPRTERVIEKPSMRQAYSELLQYRRVAGPLLVGLSLLGIADGAAATWVAPAFSRHFALSADRIGATMGAVLFLSGVLGPIVGGVLADRCQISGGARRTMWVLSALSLLTIPAALFAVAWSAVAATVAFFVFMTLGGAIIVTGTTLFTVIIPNELRGLCMALLSAAFLLFGFGVAPVAVSLWSGAMGGPAMIGQALAWVCVITSLLGTGAFFRGIFAFEGNKPRAGRESGADPLNDAPSQMA